jgi:hypothetical protein
LEHGDQRRSGPGYYRQHIGKQLRTGAEADVSEKTLLRRRGNGTSKSNSEKIKAFMA